MTTNTVPVLRAEKISVSYGSVHAVRGVDLEIAQGEVLGVIGANGAGKSSLVNAISGAVPASGTVLVGGTSVEKASISTRIRSGLAVSPEGRGILAGLSVEENLQLGAFSVRRRDGNLIASRMNDAFEIFPVLRERRQQEAQTLSGGEAAMLSVARALMSGPTLLMLDEPTLGLAPIMRATLFERLALLKQTGISMIIVEQRAAELLEVADRVMHMKQGEAEGTTDASDVDAESLARLYFGVESA